MDKRKCFCKKPNPSILEIGVDVGQTLLPIMNYFSVTRGPYKYVGLDIRRDENLCAILGQCLMLKDQKYILFEKRIL